MDTTKPALKSKTIRGSISEIVVVLALLAGFFGFDIDGDAQAAIKNNADDIFVAGLAIWSALNNLLIIYGRITATQAIATPRAKKMILPALLLAALPFAACASATNEDVVTIRGFTLLIISDIGVDNVQDAPGPYADLTTSIPIKGAPVPLQATYSGGGILSKSRVVIESATGGTVIIERAASGNLNAELGGIIHGLFKPVDHPFGNITVQDGDAMREHVTDER